MKRRISVILSVIICLVTFAGCGNMNDKDENIKDIDSIYNFTELVDNEKEFAVGAGEEVDLLINTVIDDKNYVKIDISNDISITGKIIWENKDDNSKTGEELFFIKKDSEEPFYQILDNKKKCDYDKKLTKISFKNVSDLSGRIVVSSLKIGTFDKAFTEVYISNDLYKLGVSLETGGGIHHVEKLNSGIVQVQKQNGDMAIGVDYNLKYPDAMVIDNEVNLINKHDHGRLIQQAYYGTDKPPYVNGVYMGNEWGYNPVQGGDVANNSSVICDYKNDGKTIYIKIRPLDWAKKNEVTPSYMENWYSFEDDLIVVKNRFTDFSGYVHNSRDQELPAFYGVAPLSRFVSVKNGQEFFVEDAGWWGTQVSGKNRWENMSESWYAWINEDDYGVGVCVPDAKTLLFGRTKNFSLGFNGQASINKSSTYAALLGRFELKTYDSFTYNYYLCVDELNVMHDKFREVESSFTNEDILKYEDRIK